MCATARKAAGGPGDIAFNTVFYAPPIYGENSMFNANAMRATAAIITARDSHSANDVHFSARPTSLPMRPVSDSDRLHVTLLARMVNKDEAALGQLYDLTVTRLHAVALRIVRDPGLADEVTEDALFQAWREAARFDANRGKVITWLLTICRSRALDALRRVDAAQCVEDPDVYRANEASALGEPEHLIQQGETGSAVYAAMMKLPPNERQAISLAFFRGLTHQEIADHWQMPIGSVKTLMHRAFAQLRVSLKG